MRCFFTYTEVVSIPRTGIMFFTVFLYTTAGELMCFTVFL